MKSGRRGLIQSQFLLFHLPLFQTGGYQHIAAEAAGVLREVFHEWLEWGKKSGKGPCGKYRLFLEAILQAIAHLAAGIEARDESPLDWLK